MTEASPRTGLGGQRALGSDSASVTYLPCGLKSVFWSFKRLICKVENTPPHSQSAVQISSHVKGPTWRPGHGQALNGSNYYYNYYHSPTWASGSPKCPRTSCRALGFMWLTSGPREASVKDVPLSPQRHGSKGAQATGRPWPAPARRVGRPLSKLVSATCFTQARECC